MKRRFRHYLRQGWHIARVPRMNLYDYAHSEEWGNDKHYREIRDWCSQQFNQRDWDSRLFAGSGTHAPGVKEFAFKNAEDLLMFKLKWV